MEILSRDEMARLLARNVANPALGVPEYKLAFWIKPSERQIPVTPVKAALGQWVKRLNSKRWVVQPIGQKTATPITRPIHVQRPKDSYWTFVELNARA